jgi:hypothetical protein
MAANVNATVAQAQSAFDRAIIKYETAAGSMQQLKDDATALDTAEANSISDPTNATMTANLDAAKAAIAGTLGIQIADIPVDGNIDALPAMGTKKAELSGLNAAANAAAANWTRIASNDVNVANAAIANAETRLREATEAHNAAVAKSPRSQSAIANALNVKTVAEATLATAKTARDAAVVALTAANTAAKDFAGRSAATNTNTKTYNITTSSNLDAIYKVGTNDHAVAFSVPIETKSSDASKRLGNAIATINAASSSDPYNLVPTNVQPNRGLFSKITSRFTGQTMPQVENASVEALNAANMEVVAAEAEAEAEAQRVRDAEAAVEAARVADLRVAQVAQGGPLRIARADRRINRADNLNRVANLNQTIGNENENEPNLLGGSRGRGKKTRKRRTTKSNRKRARPSRRK